MTNLSVWQYGGVVPLTQGTIDSKSQALGCAGTTKFHCKITMEFPVHRIPAGEGTLPQRKPAMMLEEGNNITEANLFCQPGIIAGTVMAVAQEIDEVVIGDVGTPRLNVIVAQRSVMPFVVTQKALLVPIRIGAAVDAAVRRSRVPSNR